MLVCQLVVMVCWSVVVVQGADTSNGIFVHELQAVSLIDWNKRKLNNGNNNNNNNKNNNNNDNNNNNNDNSNNANNNKNNTKNSSNNS